MKPLEERQVVCKLPDISFSYAVFNLTPKVKTTEAKVNRLDNKLKSFCTGKETSNKMKRQPTEWEKLSVNNISDKGLISKV